MTTYEYIVRMRGKRREQDAKSQAVKLSDTVSSYQIAPTKVLCLCIICLIVLRGKTYDLYIRKATCLFY